MVRVLLRRFAALCALSGAGLLAKSPTTFPLDVRLGWLLGLAAGFQLGFKLGDSLVFRLESPLVVDFGER